MTSTRRILTAPDLSDPQHRPLTATITFGDTTANIVLTDADGQAGEPLTLAAELAESTARRMLTQLTGSTQITAKADESAELDERPDEIPLLPCGCPVQVVSDAGHQERCEEA